MKFEVKNGKVKISGTPTVEDIRYAIHGLCEAHANLAGQRGPGDRPVFVYTGGGFQAGAATGSEPGTLNILFETPLFGFVGVRMTADQAESFIEDIKAKIASVRDQIGPVQ